MLNSDIIPGYPESPSHMRLRLTELAFDFQNNALLVSDSYISTYSFWKDLRRVFLLNPVSAITPLLLSSLIANICRYFNMCTLPLVHVYKQCKIDNDNNVAV